LPFDTAAWGCAGESTGDFFFYLNGSSQLAIGRNYVAQDSVVDSGMSIGGTYHVAVTRASGVVRFFVNWTKIGGDFLNTFNYVFTSPFRIGGLSSQFFYNGYVDEFRVSNIARWTNDFIPPTAPYSN